MAASYPAHPGYKARATSKAAAEGMAPKAQSLRARVFDALKEKADTPEGVAARLGEPVMNCRPRFSELSARDLIHDTGMRREAMGGRQAIVWAVTGQANAAADPQATGGQLAHAA
ncbi:hypothetical protein [Phenylobacterium sp.]|uniref:hypothetical protein n=1 Tax=Phenylobacterium sp. TaxID=1871053 RepID=UPI0027172182|nr:hypothetical protein [Phenylobacterium sp.]MDO8800074.1 hypothetical protein [Phenylobacterium sp.]